MSVHSQMQSFYLPIPGAIPPFTNQDNTDWKFTDSAIYIGASDLVKVDYSGNVLWSISPNPFIQIITEHTNLLGADSTHLVKLNSNGQVIWAKDFSPPVCITDTNPNFITGIAYDGNFIYVSTRQMGDPNSQYIRQGIFVLDTSGILQSSARDTALASYEPKTIFPVEGNGIWLSMYDQIGIVHPVSLIRIDSTGNIISNSNRIELSYQITTLQNVQSINDSLFLATFNISSMDDKVAIVVIDKNGNYYWSKLISSATNVITTSHTTVDENGNVYMVLYGTFDAGQEIIPLIIKLNSTAQYLVSTWSYPEGVFKFKQPFNSYLKWKNRLCLKEEYLLCGGYTGPDLQPAMLVIDTTLMNSCFAPDTLANINISTVSSIYISPVDIPITWNHFNYSMNTFSPVYNLIHTTSSLDLCNLLTESAKETNSFEFVLSPNPANDLLYFSTNRNEYFEFEIFSLVGTKIRKGIFYGSSSIDISDLPNGIYIATFIVDHFKKSTYLIVSHN